MCKTNGMVWTLTTKELITIINYGNLSNDEWYKISSIKTNSIGNIMK
jgi:hypothetical protein